MRKIFSYPIPKLLKNSSDHVNHTVSKPLCKHTTCRTDSSPVSRRRKERGNRREKRRERRADRGDMKEEIEEMKLLAGWMFVWMMCCWLADGLVIAACCPAVGWLTSSQFTGWWACWLPGCCLPGRSKKR